MKILTHVCCAPCFTYVHKKLKEEGNEVIGFWYNPNIHPFLEYRARLESLLRYQELENVEIIYKDEYNLKEFLKGQVNAKDRCKFCYEHRLRETAKTSKEKGFEAFTTTLLESPFQKHELIKEIGEKSGKEFGVKFYYEDFRAGHEQGKKLASALSLYRQRYCGCIFSEHERFGKRVGKMLKEASVFNKSIEKL
ncbi:MAG: epoxyqueuosine reductase QueH [Candidatus Thermoplasmatota archaeon]|nr:epoxyqueuosine reductase QueH [Candidatus Thermoplasmatota archaeon]